MARRASGTSRRVSRVAIGVPLRVIAYYAVVALAVALAGFGLLAYWQWTSAIRDIDKALKLGLNHPMGPFELLDVVGNDVSLAIQRELYLEFREPGFAPAPLLEHLVTAGYLGRKAGRGLTWSLVGTFVTKAGSFSPT